MNVIDARIPCVIDAPKSHIVGTKITPRTYFKGHLNSKRHVRNIKGKMLGQMSISSIISFIYN